MYKILISARFTHLKQEAKFQAVVLRVFIRFLTFQSMLFSLLKTFLSCFLFFCNVERINRDHYPQHPNQRQALLTFWQSSLNQPTFCIHCCLCSVAMSNSLQIRGRMLGFRVLHYLPEFAQTHVCWVGEAIQPSHLLSSPSPPAFKLAQHQGLFQWVSSSHQGAMVLGFQLQHQQFQEIFRPDFLLDSLVRSPCYTHDPCYPRDSRESSPAPQLESSHYSLCFSHGFRAVNRANAIAPV